MCAQLASPVDGRYGPLDPDELQPAIAWLARQVDLAGARYVLGIPEGGCIPAYAFAIETGMRVVLASIWRPAAPGDVIAIQKPLAFRRADIELARRLVTER